MFVFVLVCITLCAFLFCNYLDEEERAGCFACLVVWISCYCKCPWLFPTLPCVGLQFVIVVLSDHTHFLFQHSHPIINQHYYFTKHSCGILLIEYLFSTLHLYASNCLNAGIQTCFVHN